MRPIKFRLWDEARKRMIFGPSDDHPSPSQVLAVASFGDSEREREIMQYTGKKDLTNPPKEIYESDIVRFEDTNNMRSIVKAIIVWYEERAQLLPREFKENHKGGYFIHDWGCCDGLEVIGNIYENPDLLK